MMKPATHPLGLLASLVERKVIGGHLHRLAGLESLKALQQSRCVKGFRMVKVVVFHIRLFSLVSREHTLQSRARDTVRPNQREEAV
jgi:hypothetical protein